MNALVTGATGFIGSALVGRLDRPTILSRDPRRARRLPGGVTVHAWQPVEDPPPAEAFRGAEVVFNLMGEPVANGRWTGVKLARIRASRVVGTRNLVAGIAALPAADRPKVLVSASAIGYYGSRGDEALDESSPSAEDFLGSVCREWEAEAARAREAGVRVVCVRTGIVLGRRGGALAQMLLPFRLGLGGRLGNGQQWMSWIHLDDLLDLYLLLARRSDLSGAVNGTAPGPVRNAEFTAALAAVLRRPAIFPVPEFALRLAFGGAAAVMLGSQRVLPRAAERAGFGFTHPALGPALKEILGA